MVKAIPLRGIGLKIRVGSIPTSRKNLFKTGLAQLVEHRPFKPIVTGSIPVFSIHCILVSMKTEYMVYGICSF